MSSLVVLLALISRLFGLEVLPVCELRAAMRGVGWLRFIKLDKLADLTNDM